MHPLANGGGENPRFFGERKVPASPEDDQLGTWDTAAQSLSLRRRSDEVVFLLQGSASAP